MERKKQQRKINKMIRTINQELVKYYGTRFDTRQLFFDDVKENCNNYEIGFAVTDHTTNDSEWLEYRLADITEERLHFDILEAVVNLLEDEIEPDDDDEDDEEI